MVAVVLGAWNEWGSFDEGGDLYSAVEQQKSKHGHATQSSSSFSSSAAAVIGTSSSVNGSGSGFDAELFKETPALNGWASYSYSNNDFYEGEWRDGVKHGFGKYQFANGAHYEVREHF